MAQPLPVRPDSTRRALTRAALGMALLAWARPPLSAATLKPSWRSHPFPLGVASGLPRPDSVVLWTRLLPAPEEAEALALGPAVPVGYEVFADDALRRPVASGEVLTDAARAHSVHVLVRGLAAGREYWYRFHCGGATSPVGRTRTAPAPDASVSRLRLALASCQHWEHGLYAPYRDLVRQQPDLVLFVGDYIYEGTSRANLVRQHGASEPLTLEEYRARHALYKSDPLLQAAHAACPWVLTWDDHEVVNDYANDRDPRYSDPALFLRRRAAAYQAYFEHMPLIWPTDTPARSASVRLHDRMTWGQLAELWTLDNRQYRSHHACPDPFRGGGRPVVGCEELLDPRRSMLGTEQENWLTQGLVASRRQWKLVGQSTQMVSAGLEAPWPAAAGGLRSFYTDGWDGYPHSRRRLLATIDQAQLSDVVVLGGDVHYNMAGRLRMEPNDPASPVLASEFVTTSISSRGMSNARLQLLRGSNPDMVFARSDQRGYTLVDLTPKTARSEFRASSTVDTDTAPLAVQAAYVVEAGRPGVLPG